MYALRELLHAAPACLDILYEALKFLQDIGRLRTWLSRAERCVPSRARSENSGAPLGNSSCRAICVVGTQKGALGRLGQESLVTANEV
jgi:hypothetical protein